MDSNKEEKECCRKVSTTEKEGCGVTSTNDTNDAWDEDWTWAFRITSRGAGRNMSSVYVRILILDMTSYSTPLEVFIVLLYYLIVLQKYREFIRGFPGPKPVSQCPGLRKPQCWQVLTKIFGIWVMLAFIEFYTLYFHHFAKVSFDHVVSMCPHFFAQGTWNMQFFVKSAYLRMIGGPADSLHLLWIRLFF